MQYQVDEKGYYGRFGGAFIPEMLYPNILELKENYLKIMEEAAFRSEFEALLKTYVGRPTPLYFAERLSEVYDTRIYLKREDLCHTGAHKVNNTVGQILRQSDWAKQELSRKPVRGSMAWLRLPFVPVWGWNALYTWVRSIFTDRHLMWPG